LIFPRRNSTTTAFIIGPYIQTKTLKLTDSILYTFLKRYRPIINKCAREMMAIFPPEVRSRGMCLCLTEFTTHAWKTVHITTDSKPSPLPLSWKSVSDDEQGSWILPEVPIKGSTVRGAFGNHIVISCWKTLSDSTG
jgi:hypothetical protein